MKKIWIFLLTMLLMCTTALAGGLSGLSKAAQPNELPDPSEVLGREPILYDGYFEVDETHHGIAYAYPMPEDWAAFMDAYSALCEAAGYEVEEVRLMGQAAWKLTSGGKSAWLFPEYKGCLLVVADGAIPFTPIPTPEPTATPKPTATPRPTAVPTAVPKGHWEYIETKQDCFACVGGVCDLCNGSGWYRAYGEKVVCSTYCQTCDGVGWWVTQTAVWVYD